MAKKLSKHFFDTDEILFIGYSRRNVVFSEMVRKAFMDAGKKVYPVNPHGSLNGVTVYESVDKVPVKPSFAYVLTNRMNTRTLVETLASRGVKKILFNSMMSVDRETLAGCSVKGIETAVACPLMAFGKGFHRFHGFLSGVEKCV